MVDDWGAITEDRRYEMGRHPPGFGSKPPAEIQEYMKSEKARNDAGVFVRCFLWTWR